MQRRKFLYYVVVTACEYGLTMRSAVANSHRAPSDKATADDRYSLLPDNAKYKYNSKTLFYDAPLNTIISANLCYTQARSSVASLKSGYLWSEFGPHKDYVEKYSQWKWLNSGGDWLDSAGKPQGASACWTFSASAVTSGGHTYTVNMTVALQQCFALNTWNAWIVRCAQNRSWATRNSATPPVLFVTYTDGKTEMLKCLATVGFVSGSAYTRIGFPSILMWNNNAALEFERPKKAVASATMQFTIVSHVAGAATVSGFLCNPPINKGVKTTGISAAYPLDAGIAAHPSVRFSQRYADGTTTSDYIALGNTPHNIGFMSEWSPHLFGIGAANKNKLPYSWNGTSLSGKLIQGAVPTVPPVVVPSTYTGEGFTPVAKGIGALKIVIPGNHAADGANVGSAGSLGADLWAFLPEAECGLIDDLYVRYQVMYAPYPRQSVEQTKMFRSEAAAQAVYMTPRGKTGFGPNHWTAFGGNNRTGGGNLGWSSRGIYTSPNDMDPNSLVMGWHSLDMWYGHEPRGTQGGCVWAGQQGGIGTRFKRGQWYDVEVRLKLNTWTEDWINNATHDGIYQMWIDGVLAIDFHNFSFRQGPLNYINPADVSAAVSRGYTPTNRKYRPPFRQLGHVGIWLNEYQGGVISCEFDQTVFYSNVVAATSRIGPVSLTRPGSAWAPAAGSIVQIGYAKGAHPRGGKAVLQEIDPKYYKWNPNYPGNGPWGGKAPSNVYGFNSITAYAGSSLTAGRKMIGYGAGHAAYCATAPYAFDLETLSFEWLAVPIPSDGLTKLNGAAANAATVAALYPADQFNTDWADWQGSYSGWPAGFEQSGKVFPETKHAGNGLIIIPGNKFGNTNGALLVFGGGAGVTTGSDMKQSHTFDFDTRTWSRTVNKYTANGFSAGGVAYDPVTNKVFAMGHVSSTIKATFDIFDVVSRTWSTKDSVNAISLPISSGGFRMHPPSGLLLYFCPERLDGTAAYDGVRHRIYAIDPVSLISSTPTSWTKLTVTATSWPLKLAGSIGGIGWSFCPENGCYYAVNGRHGSKTLWKLSPPAGATTKDQYAAGTWTVTSETLSGAIDGRDQAGGMTESYVSNRLQWDSVSRSFLWFSDWYESPVQALRPHGL